MWEDDQPTAALGEFRKRPVSALTCSFAALVDAQKQVNRLSISPDKRILAAAGYNAVRLYDINDRASNNPVRRLSMSFGDAT